MKRLLRSKLILSLVAFVMIVTTIVIPFSSSFVRTHAQGTVTFTEFPVPTINSNPNGVTAGPDGNLWFNETGGNKISMMTPSGTFTEYPVPTSNSGLENITTGPDGNLWFTESNGNQIGRITPSGSITEFSLPNGGSFPNFITTGPDGNLWFTASGINQIERITTSGTVTGEFPVPTSNSGPRGITAGPDGNLWFTEVNGNQIGRITPTGIITEYSVQTSGSYPWEIIVGPDGNLWFTEFFSVNIGQITPSGLITEFPLPNGGSPDGITAGPQNSVWFTEWNGNQIGQANLSNTTPTSSPSPTLPGGIWITPSDNFVVQGKTLHFAAYAYPTNPGDPLIDHVNFTAMWPGANWRIVNNPTNTVVKPISKKACGGHANCYKYSYDWNLAQASVPNGGSGPITVSFDVYDKSGNYNLAPNGLHQEGTTWNPPMLNWQVIGFQPGQGDHKGRDFWAIDLFSNNSAIYPVLPGTVVYAQWNCQTVSGKPPCYGNVVVLDHGNGLYSIYAHLAATGLPSVGQSVGINDQIGTMSDSGCSGCGIHLHFAVRIGLPNLGANALFGSNTPVRTPL